MNTFKPLFMLLVCFVMASLSFSNKSIANDTPIINEAVVACTIDGDQTTVSETCNNLIGDQMGTDDYTVVFRVPVTGVSGSTVTVMLTEQGGASATFSGTASTTGNGTTSENVEVSIDVTGASGRVFTVNLDINCGGGSEQNVDSGTDYTEATAGTYDCPPGACVNCYTADGAYIEDANSTGGAAGTMGGELCGTATETFTGNSNLFTNGTVGSVSARTVLIQAKNSVTMEAGTMFDAMGTGMITVNVDPGLTDCVPLTNEDGEVARNIVVDNNNIAAGAAVVVTPNPFSSSATINYTLSAEEQVVVSVYNMRGEKVATLMNGLQVAGTHSVHFDASDLPKGFYYLSLRTSTEQVTEQMVIMR